MPKSNLDISSAMPMVRLARTAGQGAIRGAKNQLDALRAENPQAYDKSMQEQGEFNDAAHPTATYWRRKALSDFVLGSGKNSTDKNDSPRENTIMPEGMLLKKGGVIKSSASSRADGCAVKGKTKGRFV